MSLHLDLDKLVKEIRVSIENYNSRHTRENVLILETIDKLDYEVRKSNHSDSYRLVIEDLKRTLKEKTQTNEIKEKKHKLFFFF